MADGNLAESAAESQNNETDTPVVYMTTDISSQGLMNIYQALSASPSGKFAVKLSIGEPGSNYLRTELIGELVQSLDGTIAECNTAYGGSRANTAMHYQVAEDHGYTAIADVEEAAELLAQYDMHASAGMMVHFALSDAAGHSVAVEYVDNELAEFFTVNMQ